MRFRLEFSNAEVSALVVTYGRSLGFHFEADDISWNYGSCEIGRHTMIEHPRKRPEVATPAPAEVPAALPTGDPIPF